LLLFDDDGTIVKIMFKEKDNVKSLTRKTIGSVPMEVKAGVLPRATCQMTQVHHLKKWYIRVLFLSLLCILFTYTGWGF